MTYNVTLVTNHLSPTGGGLGQVTNSLALALEARDEVAVSVFAVYDPRVRELSPSVTHKTYFTLSSSYLNLWAMVKSICQIVQQKPSLIHVNGLWSPHILAAYCAAKILRIPFVVAPHGSLSRPSLAISSVKKKIFGWLIHNRVLRSAYCILATNVEEQISVSNFNANLKCEITPNGIELPDLHSMTSERKTQSAVVLGRLHPIKGVDELLEIWPDVRRLCANATLDIYGFGDEPYRTELTKKICQTKGAHYHGAVFGEDKFKALARACFFTTVKI